MRLCDLHTHSHFSDGVWSPTQIIDEAERLGLCAVALTDHNNINGLREFAKAAEGKRVEAVLGIEISTDYRGKELHVVGLYISQDKLDEVEKLVSDVRERKEKANTQLVENLKRDGYDVDVERIKAETKGFFNRAHVASALFEKGYVSSVTEAFDTLLSKGGGYYVESKRIETFEAIRFLKSVGAAAVLAHPFLELNEAELREFITGAKEYGLDAIETHYSTYDAETTALAERIALETGIKQSGGSDFHADRKPDISLGKGRGNLAVPAEFAEELRPKKPFGG